jgi:hypothetical protein
MLFKRRLSAAVFLVGIVVTPAARAQVHDNAQLFSPEAIRKADQRIEEMRRRFGKTLLIETLQAPPEECVKDINLGDAKMRDEFFAAWVDNAIDEAKLDGIYVLICREPKVVRVAVHPDSTTAVFTKRNQKFLHDLIIDRIQPDNPNQGDVQRLVNSLRKKRRNDDGLLAAVDYVAGKLESNGPVDESRFLMGLMIIAGVLCFWTLLVMMRGRLRKWTPAEAGVHVEDEGGRSIAVLGGGIGAVSGQWLFSRLTRRWRRPPATVAENVPAEEPKPSDHFPEEP